MVARFHEVQTVYHNHIRLRLYAVKPCQSLGALPYHIMTQGFPCFQYEVFIPTYRLPIPFCPLYNIYFNICSEEYSDHLCINYCEGSHHATYYICSFPSFDTIAVYRFQFRFGLYIVFRVSSIFGFSQFVKLKVAIYLSDYFAPVR